MSDDHIVFTDACLRQSHPTFYNPDFACGWVMIYNVDDERAVLFQKNTFPMCETEFGLNLSQ